MGRRPSNALLILALLSLVPVLGGCHLLFPSSFIVEEQPTSQVPEVVSTSPVGAESPPIAGSPGAVPTAEQLAGLLGPDDFASVGVAGAGVPTINGGPGEAYIVYAGLSAGAGGIELDAFVFDTAEEAAALVPDPGLFAVDAATKQGIGADLATFVEGSSTNDGAATFDSLRAQKGRLVVELGIPTTATSRDQLLQLVKLVLARSTDFQ